MLIPWRVDISIVIPMFSGGVSQKDTSNLDIPLTMGMFPQVAQQSSKGELWEWFEEGETMYRVHQKHGGHDDDYHYYFYVDDDDDDDDDYYYYYFCDDDDDDDDDADDDDDDDHYY